MKRLFTLIALFYLGLTYGQDNFMLAENYLRQSEYEKAAEIYKTLLKRNPYNTTYLKRLATCFQETDQYQKADSLIRSSLNTNPGQKYLYVELGYNYERQQKLDSAKIQYEKALEAVSENPSLGGLTGRMFRQNNLLDNAIKAYQLTMELNPNASYQFQVAQIYGEKGEFAQMFDAYVTLVDKNESYIGTVQRLSSRFISDDPTNENNIALKRSLLRKSVSNPKNVWNELLSWLFTKQKEYNKALIQEKALFKRNPDYLENIETLGRIAFDNEDYNTAEECFKFLLKNTNFIDEKINDELYLLRILVAFNNEKTDAEFNKVLDVYGVNVNTIAIQIEYAY